MKRVTDLLEQLGRLDEAIVWYQRAAEAGDRDARRRAAELLERAGRLDEAIDWLQVRHEAGDFYALEQAIDWIQARVGASQPLPPGQHVSVLRPYAGGDRPP